MRGLLGGRCCHAIGELSGLPSPKFTDLPERGAIMRALPERVPHGLTFFVRLGLVNSASPDEFAGRLGRGLSHQIAVGRPGQGSGVGASWRGACAGLGLRSTGSFMIHYDATRLRCCQVTSKRCWTGSVRV